MQSTPRGTMRVFVIGLGWPGALFAQSTTIIQGQVTTPGRPPSGATVSIDGRSSSTAVDSVGRYRLVIAEGGLVAIVARAVGFYPGVRRLALADGDTVELDFRLEPVAQQLDSVAVVERGPTVSARMRAFEERRREGLGRFYTREFLAEREHSTTASVLRMTAGVSVVTRPSRSGGGYSVATGRSGARRLEDWMICAFGQSFPAACYFAIYLDGVRFWVPGSTNPPNINDFRVRELEAIEVYRGPAEVPMQYQNGGTVCGVVLLWTRER